MTPAWIYGTIDIVRCEPVDIPGVHVFTPQIHHDHRGSLLELFQAGRLPEGIPNRFWVRQANCVVSTGGVIRGIHFADVPPGQAKYVSCVAGAVLDVVVDVRTGSPTFGQWYGIRLDDDERKSLYVPEGIGHALLALTSTATVVYLCSEPYDPARERGIHPLDPTLGIAWPGQTEPVLSAKDAAAPTLAQAHASGLLPDYQACLAYYARHALPSASRVG